MENVNKNMSIVESINVNEAVQVMNKINQFQQVIKSQLRPKVDFGIIPGTDKPTLLKPGAEKILMLLGVTSTYELLERVQDYDQGFFAYTVKCELSKDGIIITEGLGHCNSRERKFMSQKVDPYTIANTCLKMAKKRAQVDAVLTLASLSDVFTQDIEDMEIPIPEPRAKHKPDDVDSEETEEMEYMPPEEAASAVVNFGKYRGKTIREIASLDMNYVRWLAHKAEDAHIRLAAESLVHLAKAMKEQSKAVDTAQALNNDTEVADVQDNEEETESFEVPF